MYLNIKNFKMNRIHGRVYSNFTFEYLLINYKISLCTIYYFLNLINFANGPNSFSFSTPTMLNKSFFSNTSWLQLTHKTECIPLMLSDEALHTFYG